VGRVAEAKSFLHAKHSGREVFKKAKENITKGGKDASISKKKKKGVGKTGKGTPMGNSQQAFLGSRLGEYRSLMGREGIEGGRLE